MVEIDKKCENCGLIFKVFNNRVNKYCSVYCRHFKAGQFKNEERICAECSKTFKCGKHTNKTFCSKKCRHDRDRKIWKENNPNLEVPSATVGAIGELRVCTDLMLKGYHVYRALSPACPADLAITFDNKLYRVEVTTASVKNSGKVHHCKRFEDNKFEILALVFKSGEIIYEPNLPSLINKEQKCNPTES